MYFELLNFVEFLESQGELIRIREFVDPKLEIAEVVDRVSKNEGGSKALLFENNGTEFPLLINAMGSSKRMAYALGVNDVENIPQEIHNIFKQITTPRIGLIEKLKMLPLLKQAVDWAPKSVKSKKPECQEVIMPSPNLNALPILQCWPYDGGRFITLPCVHTKSLTTGIRNVGMYRMQVFDAETTGMHWHRHKTGAKHFEEYAAAGKTMPVVVTLGGDPVYAWCATAPLPDNVDEYLMAGFLRNRPVRMAPCLTQDMEVPEDVDFVIEGYIDPSEALVTEGPFGDHTGFYSLQDLYPKLHITCITHKQGAIYPATLVGVPPQEDAHIAKATERIFLSPIRMIIAPEITDINMPEHGVAHNLVIVSIDKKYPGQALKIANALWGAGQMMFCKMLIITDSKVNIHNTTAVMDALAEHWTPDADTHFTRGPLDMLDHAARQPGFGGKMCLDATEKLPEERSDHLPKQSFGKSFAFTHADKAVDLAKLTCVFDNEVDIDDFEMCLWLVGGNVDPAYDCRIKNGSLLIDARCKAGSEGFHRPWPNVLCMSDFVIETIDEKWDKLELGKFIPSPSLKYKSLVKNEGATAMVKEI
jgi:4-hydroxy-3-polyprenylbenzoate decarboxylase